MEKFCSGLTAIVIGSTKQNHIREITTYLDQTAIPFELCEDIYSAAAAMIGSPAGMNLVIIGCFMTIAAENMKLFSLAPKGRKVFFCCFVEKWIRSMQTKLLAAAHNGAFIINDTNQLENIIKQCTGAATQSPVRQKPEGKNFASRITSLADSFFLTQAEQDALLGVEKNANTENAAFTK